MVALGQNTEMLNLKERTQKYKPTERNLLVFVCHTKTQHTTVLIIFPVSLQTITVAQMLSIVGKNRLS